MKNQGTKPHAYEKTSVLQEKAAGASIDGGKPFHIAAAGCTTQVAVGEDVKQPSIDSESVPPAVQRSKKNNAAVCKTVPLMCTYVARVTLVGLSVCLFVCLSVSQHLMSGAPVCLQYPVTHSVVNEGQKIISETASLQKPSTSCIAWLSV